MVIPRRRQKPAVCTMTRRDALAAIVVLVTTCRLSATSSLATLIGTGVPGFSDHEVSNPYGIIVGPDGGVYFCDLDNQRVRRFDLGTGATRTIAGDGQRAYQGDGGPATTASLNMPHEIQFDAQGNLYIAERDNHVIRKVEARSGIISTLAGTGAAGFSGDGASASRAHLRQPHSLAIDREQRLLICDIGNHRIRRVDLAAGVIDTYAGTGTAAPTPDGASKIGAPLNGPRTLVCGPDGSLYLALREGNAIYRVNISTDTLRHVAGTEKQGYSGDGGPARSAELCGPKGLAYDARTASLFVADTENHVIRKVDMTTGRISTVLGNGQRGDGPEADPLQCKLSRPHGLCLDATGLLYVTDSESHRIRTLR